MFSPKDDSRQQFWQNSRREDQRPERFIPQPRFLFWLSQFRSGMQRARPASAALADNFDVDPGLPQSVREWVEYLGQRQEQMAGPPTSYGYFASPTQQEDLSVPPPCRYALLRKAL
jgi:hypothetical protein